MKSRLFTATLCYVITSASLAQAEPLNVVASFSIIGDFAQQVGQDRISLKVLVGPESDAHVYEPRPADAMALADADVVLTNGLSYEGFLSRLISASGTDAPVVALAEGGHVLDDPAGGHSHSHGDKVEFHAAAQDPHAWQSVANAQAYVDGIAHAFCAADAEGCAEYEANAARYNAELAALDQYIRDEVAEIPPADRAVVVSHNAFRYFEDAYGITFLSPQGVSTEAEASAADVAGLIHDIREHHAGAIFAENISDTRLLERVASETGLKIAGSLYSDALSPPDGPAPTYLQMMRHNADLILSALRPQ